MQTLNQFIAAHKLHMTCERVDNNPLMDPDGSRMDNWRCVIRNGSRKRFTTAFSMGTGHNGREPKLTEIFDCMALNSAGITNARDFADWCSEYGYNTNSRKAERMFRACERQASKLRAFMGETDYETLLWQIERE